MTFSSARIIHDEDSTGGLIIEGTWLVDAYNESEILMEDDEYGPDYAIHCPSCDIIFTEDLNYNGRCPSCGFQFDQRRED